MVAVAQARQRCVKPAGSTRPRFIAVFPNALARDLSQRASFAANPQLWTDASGRFYPGQNAADDIGFLAALLDEIAARFAVDADRVYATDFSNGASMAFRAGVELAPRLAAIAPVAGALWVDPQPMRRPVPLLYITGTADPLNPIDGRGGRANADLPPGAGAEGVDLAIDGLGHVWPGGRSLLPARWVGPSSDLVRANDVIWDFFRRHPRRPSE